MKVKSANSNLSFLKNGGEMGELMRNKDWSKTSIGDPESWPQSLRTTISIVLNSKFPMFLWWGEDLICFYNDAYRPSLGNEGKHPSILGERAEVAWEEIWETISPMINQVLLGGESVWNEDLLVPIYRNGKIEDVYWTFGYSPVYNDNEKIGGVLVTCTETTKKVIAARELKESERSLRLAIMQAPVAISIYKGANHVIKIANEKALELSGRETNQLLGKPLLEAVPELAEQGFDKYLKGVYNTGVPFSATELPVEIERKGKKETVYVNFSYEPLYDSNEKISGIQAVGVDVTPQVLAKQELKKGEENFRMLADTMPQQVWAAAPDGSLNYYNQAVYDYSGYTYEEIERDGWLQIVHPEDRDKNIEKWMHSVTTGEDFLYEHRFKKHTGEYRWQLSRAIPIKDDSGNIVKWVGTSTDIQDQKMFTQELEKIVKERTQELRKTNKKLEFSIKELEKINEELKSFAYVSSHDLQEPLRKIKTFTARIAETEEENLTDKGKNYFNRIKASAGRMQNLIEDLLAYSRTNTSTKVFEKKNLGEIVNEVKNDLEEALNEKDAIVEIGKMCEFNLISFQMRQVFANLFSNSIKFSKSNKPLKIKINSKIQTGKEINNPLLSDEKKYSHIIYVDNGIGFDSKYQERIFEVFQRLHGKNEYKGTGIGLAIVKKIIENHNGKIKAESSPNKGVRFDIYIPTN